MALNRSQILRSTRGLLGGYQAGHRIARMSKAMEVEHLMNDRTAYSILKTVSDILPLAGSPSRMDTEDESRKAKLLFIHRNLTAVSAEDRLFEARQIRGHHWRTRLSRRVKLPKVPLDVSTRVVLHDLKQRSSSMITVSRTGTESLNSPNSNLTVGSSELLDDTGTLRSAVLFIGRGINNAAIDPFTAYNLLSLEQQQLLSTYYHDILPVLKMVSPYLTRAEDMGRILSSPMLSYAIIAYSTAFRTGLQSGARGVVIPPVNERLWPIPLWFTYQTKALNLLNRHLTDSQKHADSQIFLTILFLLRSAILLGDGTTARMHYKALQTICRAQHISMNVVNDEFAMVKINVISISQYRSAMIRTRWASDAGYHPRLTIEADRLLWKDTDEWVRFEAQMSNRLLTWHGNSSPASLEAAQRTIRRLDSDSWQLDRSQLLMLTNAFQTARYVWSYLNEINFEPAKPPLKMRTNQLKDYLELNEHSIVGEVANTTIFTITFIAAFASRGQALRSWFILRLTRSAIQLADINQLYIQLGKWCDPVHVMPFLLQEILKEVSETRQAHSTKFDMGNSPDNACGPSHISTPTSRSLGSDRSFREQEMSDDLKCPVALPVAFG